MPHSKFGSRSGSSYRKKKIVQFRPFVALRTVSLKFVELVPRCSRPLPAPRYHVKHGRRLKVERLFFIFINMPAIGVIYPPPEVRSIFDSCFI